MSTESDAPKTDAARLSVLDGSREYADKNGRYVYADFARELEGRCAELEKALKPFVDAYCLREELYRKSKYALEWVINLPDEWVIGLAVSMGSCRTARAAVEKGKGNL